jgi:hypothetical protein
MENSKEDVKNQDKINVDDLIKDFKIVNIDNFTSYLKDIWKVKYLIYK